MSQQIYGWHIIHTETGLPYAFCSAAGGRLTESDVLEDFDRPEDFTLVPLVVAGSVN